MKPTICLDMDGVLVDFVGGLQRALGLPYDPDHYPYVPGRYEMFTEAVVATEGRHSMSSLLALCHEAKFWRDMTWDKHGADILEILESYTENIYLTSYPMEAPAAWAGKLEWIQYHLPHYRNRIILMTADKALLARPGAIIIDDRDDNVDKFCAAGGAGYLIPQPWNSKHKLCRSAWISDLDKWMKSICATT